jgi:hypothetical protein
MASFDLTSYLNPILDKLYNPGAFSDKITEDAFIKPYTTAFENYIPYLEQSFQQNTVDPFNRQTNNDVYNLGTSQSASGNWRTGGAQKNMTDLTTSQDLTRNQNQENYNNQIYGLRNDVTNQAKDIYANERQNYYLSPTFLTNPAVTGQAPKPTATSSTGYQPL